MSPLTLALDFSTSIMILLRNLCVVSSLIIVGLSCHVQGARQDMGVYYQKQEALERLFAHYGYSIADTFAVEEFGDTIRAYADESFTDSSVILERVFSADSQLIGYAYEASELGKVANMDFIVALAPQGHIKDVVMTVYREPIGHQVRSQRFMRQFRGKSVHAPLRVGRDVHGISGATLSSWAVARGCRKAVWLVKEFYGFSK